MIVTNHQLFSHAYLSQLQADPSHDKAAASIAQGLRDWMPFRDTSSLRALVDSWVGPVLDFLSFHHESAEDAPHIRMLYGRRGDESPVGLCYVVPPGQDLNDTIKGQHPMAQVILALRARNLCWGMLTDGVRWRLVDAQSLQRYEHYLEVDLDALVQSEDPTPLRLLYAAFHRNAFAPDDDGKNGLDRLVTASQKATKAAEDHLKARVSHNEGIMAQLCMGLVRADGRDRYTEAERDAIYRDATYLLYRMLFILYAEARGLLPMDHPGYRAVSLTELVQVAHSYKRQGIPDPGATTLWDRLKRLCAAIYESDPALGIPAYDGGLFDDDDKPYVRGSHIADAYLVEALFDLAYMPDSSSPDGYRTIDYCDLSVRHLGSLYEGMIEYRLQIAEETRWARRDSKGNLRFLRTGEEGAPHKTDAEIKPGQAYFSQSPDERRATGTYYTPEYVVDYIVQQTVVRGLERRRAPLEEKLAGWLVELTAMAEHSERAKMQRTIDQELQDFVKGQALTFRVCDLAMGSGHFLVNAAHQITNLIIETLHLTPWANEAVDADSMAWRRRVVEHCLYGVDLNLMAVELAKLSLWLASVAYEKPLSFLDHHLRRGSSLAGARLEDLVRILAAPAAPSRRELRERAAGQLSMLDDPSFRQHMTTATGLLAQIADRGPDDLEDVKIQETDYEQVRAELEPYRHLGDLLVARYFGLDADEQQMRALSRSLVNGAVGRLPEHERLLTQARDIAEEQCFFHWELEFPEVFFDPGRGPYRFGTGFNAIVGNPPYVRQERLSEQKDLLQAAYTDVYSGIADLYIYFIAQGIHSLAADGLLGMITANKWLRANYAAPLRAYLPRQAKLVQLLDFGHSDVFPGTDTFPCILILAAQGGGEASVLFFADASDRLRGSASLRDHVARHGFDVPLANLQKDGWLLEPADVSDLLRRLQTEFPKLGEQPGVDALRGILTGLNEAFYVDTPTRDRLVAADPNGEPLLRKLLRSRNIRRWRPAWDGEWMIAIPSSANRTWPWSECQDERTAEEAFRATYPALHGHLKPFEARLRRRQDQGRFWWELRSCDYYDALDEPKIVAKRILFHSSFCLDKQSHWVNDSTVFLNMNDLYVLAVLNSRVMWWYIYRLWPHMKDEALRVQNEKWLSVPIPEVRAQERAEIEALAHRALAVADDSGPDLLAVEQHLQEYILDAFRLSTADIALIERTLPPRDPLVVLEGRLGKVRQPTD
jgi:hypothetical protein